MQLAADACIPEVPHLTKHFVHVTAWIL